MNPYRPERQVLRCLDGIGLLFFGLQPPYMNVSEKPGRLYEKDRQQ